MAILVCISLTVFRSTTYKMKCSDQSLNAPRLQAFWAVSGRTMWPRFSTYTTQLLIRFTPISIQCKTSLERLYLSSHCSDFNFGVLYYVSWPFQTKKRFHDVTLLKNLVRVKVYNLSPPNRFCVVFRAPMF